MRTPAQILLVALLVLSFAVSTCAQEALWKQLNSKARMLYQQGRFSEAGKVAEEALKVAEKTFGPDHPNVAQSLFSLAGVYHLQGKYAEAEALYKRSLTIREKSLGPDHIDVVFSLYNLASFYKTQGKYAEAEPLYERSLDIMEKVFGPETLFWRMFVGIWQSVTRSLAKKMKPKGWKNVREKSVQNDEGNRFLVCQ